MKVVYYIRLPRAVISVNLSNPVPGGHCVGTVAQVLVQFVHGYSIMLC